MLIIRARQRSFPNVNDATIELEDKKVGKRVHFRQAAELDVELRQASELCSNILHDLGDDRLWVCFEVNIPCNCQGIKVLKGFESGRLREEDSHPLLRWIHQANEPKCRGEGGCYGQP
ncbi:hypothetical protein KFK09_012434 [Dendrobium nobile]|uniref:Uncharacterized protein n=1 Tax=Dendrobium nobile TaxID=94219 RepID=A0A8T3BFG8_DENNO|nr:hypothetical protein KFK09_012434 [Dendrobium nobile]